MTLLAEAVDEVLKEPEQQIMDRPFTFIKSVIKPVHKQVKTNGYAKKERTFPLWNAYLPDHTQLPESDGAIVNNFLELPQSMILTSSVKPVLDQIHPDHQYIIGQDSGIYWDITDPPLDGAKTPDWFYIPNRPAMLDGELRRSYVMWQELASPLIVIEYVSGDGRVEHDQTPGTGKFWIYENAIRARYYAIYDSKDEGSLELYVLRNGRYALVAANERNHYPIPELSIELGLLSGTFMHMTFPWLRAWDAKGNLLLESSERAEQESQHAEQERQEKESALNEIERFKAHMRSLGIDPDHI